MLRYGLCLMVAFMTLLTSARGDTLKVMSAGSLRAAVTDLLQRFPIQSDASIHQSSGLRV
jgi:ABC-type molybdate transport system substrate-binding protein